MVEPEVSDPLPVAGSCGADALQGLVGQPASVLQTMKFGQLVRVIRPGQAVTMDYSEDRLNIEVDGAEVISRVSCG
ncbi:MAG: I78 family peptidase inhibitor [Paracoccaceae bacterium]